MWTLILRKEDEVYDIIPNTWLISHDKCVYPNANFKTTSNLAKDRSAPQGDWEETEIAIIRRNYDDYNRGYDDMVRMSIGKRRLSASEREEKGRGKRLRSKKRLSFGADSSGHDDSSDCSVDASEPQRKKTKPAIPTKDSNPSTSSLSINLGLPVESLSPGPSTSKTKSKSSERRPVSYSQKGLRTPVKSTSKSLSCPNPQDSHRCSFNSDGSTTMNSIARSLCHISKIVTSNQSKLIYLKKELKGLQDEMKDNFQLPSVPRVEFIEEPTQNIMGFFPIKTTEKLKEVEEKLATDKDYFNNCVAYFSSIADKVSDNRTVTSILARMLTLEVAQGFTFKGIARKDHREKKEGFKDLQISRVLLSALKRCWPTADLKKAGSTTGYWLAQAKSKMERAGGKKKGGGQGQSEDENINE